MEYYNQNGINILLQNEHLTPRFSVSFTFKVNKQEKLCGVNSLLARLLLQGTKNYSACELSEAFEKECIDVSSKAKQDYIKISLVFLNEDFKRALELAGDLIINSTFDDFEKEVYKIKGEIMSDLDNPKMKLTDAFIKNIFKNHPYSTVHTKILEDIDKITKQDIIDAHKVMLNSPKLITCVGDIKDKNEILDYFKNNFSFMAQSDDIQDEIPNLFKTEIEKDELIWITKNDVSQAQIIQGWIIDSFKSNLCAKYTVLNNILGSSGLSSRLFVNLRDKQGLAYTVRSQYETFLHSAIFSMYIGTAPKNIKKSLDGFTSELQKLADNPPDEEELRGAKENISGKMKYFTQNNSQICAVQGYNYTMGLGLNYNELFMDDVNNTTAQDVSNMAKSLLSMPKIVTIIAPEKYKSEID